MANRLIDAAYVRVSTEEQNEESQIDELRSWFQCEGIDADRPLLVQAHLLTADQIRRCFTAADPLARESR